MADHHPGWPVSLWIPAAWASPEKACRTRIALLRSAFNVPYVSYATVTLNRATLQSSVRDGNAATCVSTRKDVSVEAVMDAESESGPERNITCGALTVGC